MPTNLFYLEYNSMLIMRYIYIFICKCTLFGVVLLKLQSFMAQYKNYPQKLPANMGTCGNCSTPVHATPVEYFYTPLGRFLLFHFFTLGLYDIYWFYKNWIAIKKASGIKRIYPIRRSLFAVFFCWGLFKKIHGDAGKYGYKYQNLAHIASFLFIGSTVISCLLSIITSCSDPELALIAELLVLVLMILPLDLTAFLITQRAIKFHNSHAILGYSTRRKLTGFEWICIVLVLLVCLWLAMSIGLYLVFMKALA